MKLSDSNSIILFRFHKEPESAAESIKVLRHFNPNHAVHALFGGPADKYDDVQKVIGDLVDTMWLYSLDMMGEWKWQHTDLILKRWYRDVGRTIDFDFLFSYEYDLLTARPLLEIYPDIDQQTLALAACEPFTKEIENRWSWTSRPDHRPNFLAFCEYMRGTYGLVRQKMVCLGPGPLLPRGFMEQWSKTDDIDYVNDEIAYPAYAEALGFKTVDHGMHPGFGKPHELTKYFNCNSNRDVTLPMLKEQLDNPSGRRSFHPVKFKITLEEILTMLARKDQV